MKKIFFALIGGVFLFLSTCTPLNHRYRSTLRFDDFLRYRIVLDTTEAGLAFEVTLQLSGNERGKTKLYLPNEWGPATGLSENIQDLRVINAEVVEQTDQHLLLKHGYKDLLMIKYKVIPAAEYPFDNPDLAFHPILQNNFFQFYGNAFFIYPADLNYRERPVSLSWEGFPEDWAIHNSYGTNKRLQTFRWKDSLWLESVFVGGDYRIHKIEIKDDPVYVAMRGDWDFKDDDYLDLLKRVITQQRAFWNDHDFNYFTVTLAPFMEGKGQGSYQGTGLRNSFALNATKSIGLKNFDYLFSHELMHEWIGLQIKTADPEGLRFWFSEGFTDYFSYINMRECGLLDEQAYVGSMNGVIKEYYTSPIRLATNEALAANFFTDYTYGRLAYNRGCLFATHIDWMIRQDSKGQLSLKNAMQDFLAACKGGKQRLTDELFLTTINKYLKEPIDPLFKKYIQEGDLIKIENWMLGEETVVEYKPLSIFDLGFDAKRSKEEQKIIGLKEKSNAYKAGLRNGQLFQGSGYYAGREDIQAEVYVVIDGVERKIVFYPSSDSGDTLPQFVFK